jgi:hypothetical protein
MHLNRHPPPSRASPGNNHLPVARLIPQARRIVVAQHKAGSATAPGGQTGPPPSVSAGVSTATATAIRRAPAPAKTTHSYMRISAVVVIPA